MPTRNRKRRQKPKALSSAQYKAVKKIDQQQEWKRAPMRRSTKSKIDGSVVQRIPDPRPFPFPDSPTYPAEDLEENFTLVMAPYQDIPYQATAPVGDNGLSRLDVNVRTGSVIYPQYLHCWMVLMRAHDGVYPYLPDDKYGADVQQFRICVVRWRGETDIAIDNAQNNVGWMIIDDQIHTVAPGEMWSDKPYIKGQIDVLYDRTVTVDFADRVGCVHDLKVQIRKKLVFEKSLPGNNSVGAGNVYIMVRSNLPFNIKEYRTHAFYKEL